MRFHRFCIVVTDFSRKRWLQRRISSLKCSQLYYSRRGDWRMVVELDIKLHCLRSELYGRGYCGF